MKINASFSSCIRPKEQSGVVYGTTGSGESTSVHLIIHTKSTFEGKQEG